MFAFLAMLPNPIPELAFVKEPRGAFVVQTLLFDRDSWTEARAKAWLSKHGYETGVDVKPGTLRFRQREPSLFRRKTFRTISFGDGTGIKAVVGILKR